MGRAILSVYVGIQAFAIVLSLIASFLEGEAIHIFSGSDWWMFIISCGILTICETLEESEWKLL